jgi:hypothetical protein
MRTPSPLRSWPRTAAVVAVVVTMHGWLLGGLPQVLRAPSDQDSSPIEVAPLNTRILPAPPPDQALPAQPPLPTAKAHTRTPPLVSPTTADAIQDADGAQKSGAEQAAPAAELALAPAAPEPSASLTSAASPAEVPPPAIERVPRFAFPPSVILNYDVFGQSDGRNNVVSAAITWRHDGENYQASLAVTKFMVGLRQWTSKGALTAAGLAPVRFGEKGWRRAEVASHFVRDEGRVVFSANSAPAPLLPGAQDHLSVFLQLASLWGGEPQRLGAGDTITFQAIGPRQAETWTFVVSPEERITVPGGSMQAIKLTREPTGDYSTKAEVWLAPQLAYLPAHIRLSEANGNVLDMVWTESQTP